jgi:metallophosphoesterase superfamily enzyme
LPIGGVVASEVAIGKIVFRHEPTGALGEIAGHLHPKAQVSTRGRSMERRCFASEGERAVMPAFGAYTGGLSIRDAVFAKIFQTAGFMAHVLGDHALRSETRTSTGHKTARPHVSKAPFRTSADDFRSTPMNRHSQCFPACLKGARSVY